MSADSTLLTACGCCGGIHDITPLSIDNPSGLRALAYRVGTHGSFKETMLADISRRPELSGLGTRADDDPTIALIDSWATVLDVLTFYQERIANDGYLRTALERQSVLELAALIGYELRPGVAASTVLAFQVQDAPGTPRYAFIPIGTRAQSIPDPGELPQFFETVENIQVRAEWNTLRPRQTQPQILDLEKTEPRWRSIDGGLSPIGPELAAPLLYLEGAVAVKKGDRLLLAPGAPTPTGPAVPSAGPVRAGVFNPIGRTQFTTLMQARATPARVMPAPTAPIMAVRSPAAPTMAVRPPTTPTLPLVARRVTFESDHNRTRVDLTDNVDPAAVQFPSLPTITLPPNSRPPFTTNHPGFQPVPLTRDNINHYIVTAKWREQDLASFLAFNKWNPADVLASINQPPAPGANFGPLEIFAFRDRAGFFGHNAPQHATLPTKPNNDPIYTPDWDANGWPIWNDPNASASTPQPWLTSYGVDVFLERSLPSVVNDSWVLFEQPQGNGQVLSRVYWTRLVRESSLAAFALSGKATGLGLDQPDTTNAPFQIRRTTAFVGSEAQPLAMLPVTDLVEGQTVMLDRMVLGLSRGQDLVVRGELADAHGVWQTEIATIGDIVHFGGFTSITLVPGLQARYVRSTVTFNANVARATHGESHSEVLGSGDASTPNQTFTLSQKPLTYVSDTSPQGAASTLRVWVNDILWDEVESLYPLGPRDRAYVTRHDDDGTVRVEFGDGTHGARLPTGMENVRATYRVGTGVAGLLKATQISQLINRPLGVQSVANPLPAAGAQDPESTTSARQNAPLVVDTLDRIVSLADFENFARAFAGVAKAQARWAWDGATRIVHLTVAGAQGRPIAPGSDLYTKLSQAIDNAREPSQPLRIDSFESVSFTLQAGIVVNPNYQSDKVLDAVGVLLLQTYSFDARSLGQPVAPSDVIALMQGVEGVDAVDLDVLLISDTSTGGKRPGVSALIPEATGTKPAQLLTLQPDGMQLVEKT
jgi:hypothetical protein